MTGERGFYTRLESLRGLAALMVAGYHSFQSNHYDAAGTKANFFSTLESSRIAHTLAHALLNGDAAVITFFVLSGFVLTLSLQRGPLPIAESWTRFVVARVFRIYPAVIAAIALFVAVYAVTGGYLASPGEYAPFRVLENVTLSRATIVGVMWSLQVELLAVPVIFLGLILWRRGGVRALHVLLAALIALSSIPAWNRSVVTLYGLIALVPFVIGIIAFVRGRSWIDKCPPALHPAMLVLALAGLLAIRPVIGWSKWMLVFEATFAAVAIVCLAYGDLGRAGRLFDWRPVRFVGRVSYSFYLLHPLTMIVMWHMPGRITQMLHVGVPGPVLGLAFIVLSIAAILPLAWATYVVIERPGVAIGRWILRGMQPQTTQDATQPGPVSSLG